MMTWAGWNTSSDGNMDHAKLKTPQVVLEFDHDDPTFQDLGCVSCAAGTGAPAESFPDESVATLHAFFGSHMRLAGVTPVFQAVGESAELVSDSRSGLVGVLVVPRCHRSRRPSPRTWNDTGSACSGWARSVLCRRAPGCWLGLIAWSPSVPAPVAGHER